MAEWVHKGNLKGPQGDPGQDAQLPAGGTEGQVLTKTSGGEAWADVPEPDLTGVVKYGETGLTADGEAISTLIVGDYDAAPLGIVAIAGSSTGTGINGYGGAGNSQLFTIGANNSSASMTLDCGDHGFSAKVTDESAVLKIDSKSVTSITDDASTGSADALATAKAVKDYTDAHGMPSVVSISRGGTGATTADGARTALGIPDIEVATDEEFDSYMGLS